MPKKTTGKKRQRRHCVEIKGKKTHILVDTSGILLQAIVHPADIQDRDGGILVIAILFGSFPFSKILFTDGEYPGPKFAKALAKVLPHLDVASSNVPIGSADLPSCPNAGSLSVPLRGSRLAKDWKKLKPKSARVLAPRIHAQKTLQSGLKSPDGL